MFKKKLNKDKIKRLLNISFEIKLQVFKNLLKYYNILIESDLINFILNKISFLNRNLFFNRSNNLCILSGRQNGVYKFFKISRIQLRDSKHNIYGLRKSS